jgi:hypothetical protein
MSSIIIIIIIIIVGKKNAETNKKLEKSYQY